MHQMLALLAAALVAVPALAQNAYPSRPITMVIAFPPGGVTDVTARPTALAMERALKQRVIVENKPGAAGATGNAYVANARPDGYTVLMALSSISVIPEAERLQGNKPPYELAQFAPIALISADPVVLVVRDEAPWKNVREFVADARNRPAKITYSSSGIYGALHMPFTLLEHATGITLWHVPYNGGGPALQALLGSQVDVTVGGPAIMIGQIKAKRLRPLASFGDKRLASLPDVPTLKELAGGPGSGFPRGYGQDRDPGHLSRRAGVPGVLGHGREKAGRGGEAHPSRRAEKVTARKRRLPRPLHRPWRSPAGNARRRISRNPGSLPAQAGIQGRLNAAGFRLEPASRARPE